jgi:hypothetical protein
MPVAALALLVVNDVWLKPTFHNFVTGKLSDVAVCLLMPLFVSELLGLALALAPRVRLACGALVTAALFTLLEVVPSASALAVRWLTSLGPIVGLPGRYAMTSDPSDLLCVPLVLIAYRYGAAWLGATAGSGGASGSGAGATAGLGSNSAASAAGASAGASTSAVVARVVAGVDDQVSSLTPVSSSSGPGPDFKRLQREVLIPP